MARGVSRGFQLSFGAIVDPRVEVEIVLEVWQSRFRSIRGALQQCGFHVSEPRPRGQEIVTFTARRLEGYRLGRSWGVRAVAEASEILGEGGVVTGRVLSYSYQERPRTEWRQVKVKADGRLLQAVLVPEEEDRETTKLRAAKLHNCAVEEISVSVRLPLLIVGLAAGCPAGVLLYDFYDFMPLVTNSSYKIRVLPGLYLLLVSSLVVVIAAFVPTRHIPASERQCIRQQQSKQSRADKYPNYLRRHGETIVRHIGTHVRRDGGLPATC